MNGIYKNLLIAAVAAASLHDNDNNALIPELWANESLSILEENMVVGQLVYRDFENTFQAYGDIVHTRKPNAFTGQRKTNTDDVTIQNASSTDIQVPLDQWIHVSFLIRDGEDSQAFKDLVSFYLTPALLAEASFLDHVICGQTIRFIANNAGKLNGGSESTIDGYMLDAREVMTNNKAPVNGRNLVLTTKTDTMCQKTAQFISAEKRGDGGTALETAQLGTLHGFTLYSGQNQPFVPVGSTIVTTFLVNNVVGYGIGDTVIAVDVGAGTIATGTFLTIAGDDVPQRVTSHTETGTNSTSITLSPGLSHAVADDAVITKYTPGAVNLVAGYALGWSKAIVYDVFTVDPKIGQPVNFGDGNVYTVVAVDTSAKTITLDRPLAVALVDDQSIFVGPAGNYNLAFDRGALALVCRPLKPPRAGTGALSSVQVSNGFAVRVTITYDGTKQGHLVTVDALCGVAVLDVARGCVLLA